MDAAICSRAVRVRWISRISIFLRLSSSMPSTKATGASSAYSLRRRWKHC
jgi:hypothetical protein